MPSLLVSLRFQLRSFVSRADPLFTCARFDLGCGSARAHCARQRQHGLVLVRSRVVAFLNPLDLIIVPYLLVTMIWSATRPHYRRFVRQVTREYIRIVREPCSPAASRYKEKMLKIICSTGTHVVRRFLTLRWLPNHDWRVRGYMPVYVPPGISVNEKALVTLCVDSVDEMLCGSRISEYNRARWTGHEQAIDEYSLGSNLNGIGDEAYKRLGAWMRVRTRHRGDEHQLSLSVCTLIAYSNAWPLGCAL